MTDAQLPGGSIAAEPANAVTVPGAGIMGSAMARNLAVVADEDRLPLLEALSRQWRTAVEAGHGREDISAARLALGSRN